MTDPQDWEEFRKELERWEKKTLDSLDRFPERRSQFITTSSEPVKRLYTPADLQDKGYLEEIGFPGQYPFTRGVHPTMYRSRLWTMRMFAGFGTAEETNQRFKYLLDQGQTGLSVAFDMPTLMGYDTDAPEAEG
ncbi:MAG: methylmalonyl-CoA mutase family protein, partial [Anaerolineales bacterium]